MRLTTTLLLVLGCATARTETLPTTPAVPEPTPPEPLWAGYMVVETGSVPPAVAILFPEGPEGDVITTQTLDEGVKLRAATANSDRGYWLFPVTHGGLVFHAVRVYDDGHVTVEMPMPTQYGYATLVVATVAQRPEATLLGYVPCVHSICGPLHKATANRIVGCEGPGCAEILRPTP